jgi:hypothetical protein
MEVQVLFWFTENFGENRELTGIYEPRAKILIYVDKYVWRRRLWKRSCLFHFGCVEGEGEEYKKWYFSVNFEVWVRF